MVLSFVLFFSAVYRGEIMTSISTKKQIDTDGRCGEDFIWTARPGTTFILIENAPTIESLLKNFVASSSCQTAVPHIVKEMASLKISKRKRGDDGNSDM